MSDDDNFYVNDSGGDDEDEVSVEVRKARVEILNTIEKKLNECRENLAMDNDSDFNINFKIMSNYISKMTDISDKYAESKENIEDENSKEEMLKEIRNIEASVVELSLNDIDKINEDGVIEVDESKMKKESGNDSDDDW